jgi:hypothetical protein
MADLTRPAPGLTIQDSAFNSTSFTLRSVGSQYQRAMDPILSHLV